jgi:ATP-dependent DNA ligase
MYAMILTMNLPVGPPVSPMLAKLKPEIPRGEGWTYEPKWDGFRAIVFRDGDELHIGSRDGKPLERYFPELVEPLTKSLPERCVVDGEVVIAGPKGLEFETLLLRIHPAASRVKMLSVEHPASFVAFDLLALGDHDLTKEPLAARRAKLEEMLPEVKTNETPGSLQVLLTPSTADPEEASVWFQGLEALGLDGIVAKRDDSIYSPGERTMVKIKHQRTADCVVGGYRVHKSGDGVGSLLLGVYDDEGTLHYVGHTSSFKADERRELLQQLRELEGEGGFGSGRTPGGPSRWAQAKDQSWTPLQPVLVCEVAYDYMQGARFRHAARLLRWRQDREPQSCTFAQLERA